MAGRITKWESELWSYIDTGDGEHCPLYESCLWRKGGRWCPDDDGERLKRLIDYEQPRPASYNFIMYEDCSKIFRMVEMLASKYLKRGKVRCPPVPVELISLFDHETPVEVRQLPLKNRHGAAWHTKDGWIIYLKEDDKPATKRFVLFHEAFHVLSYGEKDRLLVNREIKVGSFNELLADAFAAYVLMPGGWVKEKWAGTQNLEQMAQIFDVPKRAMCARLRFLGLI